MVKRCGPTAYLRILVPGLVTGHVHELSSGITNSCEWNLGMVCSRTAPYRQLYGQGCASLHLAILNDSPKGILPHLPPQKNPRETVAPHHICSNNLLEKQHCVGGDMLFQALGVEKGKKTQQIKHGKYVLRRPHGARKRSQQRVMLYEYGQSAVGKWTACTASVPALPGPWGTHRGECNKGYRLQINQAQKAELCFHCTAVRSCLCQIYGHS